MRSTTLFSLLATAFGLVPHVLAQAGEVAGTGQPNVLILMADDLGYADVGVFGSTSIATPRIDELSNSGLRMESFYAHATCTPSRAALLTGRYAPRVGMDGPIGAWSPKGLDPAETTIAEVARSHGYRTALFGKWHLGDSPNQQPLNQGFDEFAGLLWGPTGIPLVFRDSASNTDEFDPDQRWDTFRATTRSLGFIEESVGSGRPFFCVTSYTVPHEPATASPAFQGISADGRDYGDAVEEMDASVGELLDRLTTLGVRNNTLVIFLSDNGATTNRDPYQNGSNVPFTGGKGSSWEGAVRVPACASWPAVIAPGRVDSDPYCIVDILPTLGDVAGAALDPTIKLDGHSLLPVFQGVPQDPLRAVHIPNNFEFQAVRRGRYKYRLGKLYDVVADPSESFDLAAAQPQISADLQCELNSITADVAADRRPAGVTQRVASRWRGGVGYNLPVVHGSTWRSQTIDLSRLVFIDVDPGVDLFEIDTTAVGSATTPDKAFRVPDYSGDIRLLRAGAPFPIDGTFSIGFWYQALAADRDEPICLLDVGGQQSGLSLTLADFGELGDDAGLGRSDDFVLRIGGAASPTSATLSVDAPGSLDTRLHFIAITRDAAGDLALYLDGLELGRVQAPGATWGVADQWALMSVDGELGGSGGPGVLPPPATRFRGDIAGFGYWDRALTRAEVEVAYARYTTIPYCRGEINSQGYSADLAFQGSFLPSDNRLTVRLRGLPRNAFGFLLAAANQDRTPVSNGSLCLSAPVFRFSAQVMQANAAGIVSSPFDLTNAPGGFSLQSPAPWNFQFWYRDCAGSNFSNGTLVFFAR